jgi:hypothetical protein
MTPPEYVPGSALARELLTSYRFAPDAPGFLTVDAIIGDTKATPTEIEGVLREFERAGLVVNREPSAIKAGLYAPGPKGWKAREHLLTTNRKRKGALIKQLDYKLPDLLLALLAYPDISNAKMSGAFFGRAKALSLPELETYLHGYAPEAIASEANILVFQGLAEAVLATRSNTDKAFAITGRGIRKYKDEIAARLGLATDEGILDLVEDKPEGRSHISIFEAWQSEYKPSRNIITPALEEVVAALNESARTTYPLCVVRATEPGDGAIRIDVALQERILEADFFIGDLTPVYAYGERLRVNENVLVEVGFALASKEPSRIILLAKSDVEVPGDKTNAKPAFDIAHVRRIPFKDKVGLKRSLTQELEALLRVAGWWSEP